jgi:WD40 repeat protein
LAIHFWKDEKTHLLHLYDAATGKLLHERAELGHWPVFSRDGRRVATVDSDHKVRVRAIETGNVLQTLTPPGEASRGWPLPRLVAFMPDGASLVLQGDAVSVWDVATGRRKSAWHLTKHKVLEKEFAGNPQDRERIESIAVSPDGRTIAFGLMKDRLGDEHGNLEWFGRIMLLETATGKLLLQQDVGRYAPERIAFSPDGRLVAAGGVWTIHVWNVATGEAVAQFEGHRGRITGLAFSPDGRRLASASEDSTVLVWDVRR